MVRGQGLSPVGFFRLQEHGTTVAREVRAGLVTFLTMAGLCLIGFGFRLQQALTTHAGVVHLPTAFHQRPQTGGQGLLVLP